MEKVQIIYDDTGYIITTIVGEGLREPVGVPFLNVEIPSGKQLKITDGIGVDVTVTPHQPIFEDIPKSEVEMLREENEQLKNSVADLWEVVLLGGAE